MCRYIKLTIFYYVLEVKLVYLNGALEPHHDGHLEVPDFIGLISAVGYIEKRFSVSRKIC